MKIAKYLPKVLIIGLLLGGIGVVANNIFSSTENTSHVDVKMPSSFSAKAMEGRIAFTKNCQTCHGENGSGSDKGPPLIHDIYNPGHHGDEAFYRAASGGVTRHHWSFGNMPAQPQVSRADMESIIKYVREIQVQNGIKFKPHNM